MGKNHTEKAMELRNEVPMKNNCAETIMRAYAEDLNLPSDIAASLGSNFGGGMKCGSVCGAITAGLMILGAKGITSPVLLSEFRSRMAESHDGLMNCSDLLKRNAERGGSKKGHCDGMIQSAIALIDEMTGEN
ncbi:MAG: C_GCAxxG_C_C family protein [Spirochaetales bacterium]|nr:C_GCAxxG_C_C family protein [Candidatus Physcosoma equi]